MKKTKGIVLIALGAPEYIKMAYNLAVSIRSVENIAITLVYSGRLADQYLSASQQAIFHSMIVCPKEYYTRSEGTSYVKAKVHLYELSPYDQTLFLDSDTAWNPYKRPSELFAELEGVSITFKNTGFYSIAEKKGYDNPKYTYWYDMQEMLSAYNVKASRVFQIQSELIYFEKGPIAEKCFATAKEIYDHPKVVSKVKFAGQNITDEMAFSISLAINGIEPHRPNWEPTYWKFLSAYPVAETPSIFTEGYYLLSIGGTYLPGYIMQLYTSIIKQAFNKIGGIPFTIKTKTKQN